MNNIKELLEISKNITALYVEDSENLQKQMSFFLEKIFKNVYKARDGQEGLDKYKELKPDIVITDLTMPKMNGFEMIKVLKQINPELKIVIISAHVDTDNLLEALHMGVSDFVPKPVDRTLLSNTLYKVCSQLIPKENKINEQDLKQEDDMFKQLEILSEQKISLEFINHYKGVPINQEGTLVKASNGEITIHAPYIQTMAIAYEKLTSFESKYLDYAVEASVKSTNKDTREVVLNNLKKSKYTAKKREQVRLEPDISFKTVLHLKNKKYDVETLDVSIRSVCLRMKKDLTLEVDEGMDVNLNMGFVLHHKGGELYFEDNQRVSAKGKIFKISEYKKDLKLVILFEMDKKSEDQLGKYIMEQEIYLIKEFKQLKLEDILR